MHYADLARRQRCEAGPDRGESPAPSYGQRRPDGAVRTTDRMTGNGRRPTGVDARGTDRPKPSRRAGVPTPAVG